MSSDRVLGRMAAYDALRTARDQARDAFLVYLIDMALLAAVGAEPGKMVRAREAAAETTARPPRTPDR